MLTACAASLKTSITIASDTPIARPSADSLARPATIRPIPASAPAGAFHSVRSISVIASERTIRAGSGAARNAASGRNATTPEILASVNRNPNRVEYVNRESTPITAQISKNVDRVGHRLVHHPGHHQQAPAQERDQPRNRVEPAVLNGSQNLNQTDYDAGNEPDREQRRADPESGEKHLAHDVSHSV